MATYASKLRPSAVDGQTIRVLPDGRIRGNAGMEPFSAGTKGGAPSVFYADGNVVSSGNGLSWLSAVKTVSEALVMAHAYESTSGNRAWAHRAIVYVCGDELVEDITLFAEKTDVIGVGSNAEMKMPGIRGNHVLVATGTDTFHGCRWINVEFRCTTGIMMDIPIGQNGQEFIGCSFRGDTTTTIGLRAVQSHRMKIIGCEFWPDNSGTGLTTAAVQINAGGTVTFFRMEDCLVYTSGIGLDFNPTVGQVDMCFARKNTIYAGGQTIDDESTELFVTENMLISAAAAGTGSAWTFNLALAAGNIETGNNQSNAIPDLVNLGA